jgi:hypothetical protein
MAIKSLEKINFIKKTEGILLLDIKIGTEAKNIFAI